MNISNASASNTMDLTETGSIQIHLRLVAYVGAVTTAIAGSVGLRKVFEKLKIPGILGKGLIACTPYIGLVSASTFNLLFSRSKDLKEGISVLHPETKHNLEIKSQNAGFLSFKDSLLIRWIIPIPGTKRS